MIHPMFILAMEILIVIGTASFVIGLVTRHFKTNTATVSMATGDNETLVLQTNLSATSSDEERKAKLERLFGLCQARRTFNHNEWLRIKAESEAENTERKLTPVS